LSINHWLDGLSNFFFDFLAFPSKSGAIGFVGWIFGSFTVIGWVLFISFSVMLAKYVYNFIIVATSHQSDGQWQHKRIKYWFKHNVMILVMP